jgi:putative transposase
MRYIDLNMVRAGVVKHPSEWPFCGYQELFGLRQRYRLIDQGRLFEVLEATEHPERLLENYRASIEEAIDRRAFEREEMWTESLAVGSEAFVKRTGTTIRNRNRVETSEAEEPTRSDAAWVLREAPPENAYGRFSGPKKAPKTP